MGGIYKKNLKNETNKENFYYIKSIISSLIG